jgi:hypothetical protein
MKKARALSTTCISALACALASTSPAQVPGPEACFVRSYDAAHLARHPGQGVQGLRLWFFDAMRGDPESRSVRIEAVLADQGQARADGVGGMTLRQTAFCTDEAGGRCFVECDGGWFTISAQSGAAQSGGGLEIETERFLIGDAEGCGGSTDLSEGRRTIYRLEAAPPSGCADLARVHPLPAPGCYGAEYPSGDADARVAGLTLRLAQPELEGAEPTFPWIEGVMQVNLGPATDLGPLAGQQMHIPFWCWSEDGLCRSGMDEGTWTVSLEGGDIVLESEHFTLHDPEGEMADITGGIGVRHVLTPRPATACEGLVVE